MAGLTGCGAVGQPYSYATAGKREAGAPVYTFGGRAQLDLAPFEFGIQAKRTGKRYVNDVNTPIYGSYTPAAVAGQPTPVLTYYQVYQATTAASNTNIPFAYLGPPRTFVATLNVQF